VYTRLASLYADRQQFEEAVRARRAILGLNPVDRAQAYYLYAQSLKEDDRQDEAKRAVLQALELAPGFREAQQLLLQVIE
jgi:tetratricopeptide (TPR) repeat protein